MPDLGTSLPMSMSLHNPVSFMLKRVLAGDVVPYGHTQNEMFYKYVFDDGSAVVYLPPECVTANRVALWIRSSTKRVSCVALVGGKGLVDASYMFSNCGKLKIIDMRYLDARRVTTIAMAFCYCKNVEVLLLPNTGLPALKDCKGTFFDCLKLRQLDLKGVNTSKVENMSYMFSNCNSLVELDVSSIDTSSATSFESMFRQCQSLKTLDVSHFDVSRVTTINDMFRGCSSLESLNLSGLCFKSCTHADRIFMSCDKLSELNTVGLSFPKLSSANTNFFAEYDIGSKQTFAEALSSVFGGKNDG